MCDLLLPLKRRFHDSQIVIITNFVILSSVGIKRVVCIIGSDKVSNEKVCFFLLFLHKNLSY